MHAGWHPRGGAAHCFDPGFNATGLGSELPFAAPLERLLWFLRIGNSNRGAGIIVRFATDPHFENVSAGYFSVKDEVPLTPVAPANDVSEQEAL